MTAAAPPPLPADLNDGLKRLKMAAMRRLAPELLVTAKTQRWKPEEFLRTLIEAEIAARDESNVRTRMRQATFPVTKTLAEFDVRPEHFGKIAKMSVSDPTAGTNPVALTVEGSTQILQAAYEGKLSTP